MGGIQNIPTGDDIARPSFHASSRNGNAVVVIIMFVFMCHKSVSNFMVVSDKARFGHIVSNVIWTIGVMFYMCI